MTSTQLSKLIIQFVSETGSDVSKEDIAIMILSKEYGISNRKKVFVLRQLFNVEDA